MASLMSRPGLCIRSVNMVISFPLIIKNANFHGIGTGNRDSYESLMAFVSEHGIKPVISERFALDEIKNGFEALNTGSPFGKVILEMG